MKRLTIGILAHVDAGKTTLAESILFETGSIRSLGRVDHKDTFLDTYELERTRGITIFSKQAKFSIKDMEVTLLDTPGHVDFSSEMERTLQVLDYGILVVSGSEGIQGHTKTLWRLLTRYQIPTFIFVNKMDLDDTNSELIMRELKQHLNVECIDFLVEQTNKTQWMESLAMCDEDTLEKYINHHTIDTPDVVKLISGRKVFPCFFGSALRQEGVREFLSGLTKFTKKIFYGEDFGAKVYKITRDEQGSRLTLMKITSGSLRVKMPLTSQKEKVDQIRIYSGVRYEAIDEAVAGMVCAVTGLSKTYPGEGLGIEAVSSMPILEPILNYQILLPEGCDAHVMLSKLRLLEEEDPQLNIVWSEQLSEIHVKLMGEVQIEILQSLILERFGVKVEFGQGTIVYKETIMEPVVGIGHFEPLRHYAEVHLLLEPDVVGSGLTFSASCSEDILDRSWQRLIINHLEEKEHIGVLTGSPIIDMNITLINGRAHQKHTEGGDFRQATYRALRQGLKKTKSSLLEPYYNFKLEVPSESVGRAMSDITRMHGNFNPPEIIKEVSILTGYAPVATMQGYQTKVTSYTKGRGKLFCDLKGYDKCYNEDEVIASMAYDSERDLNNPTSSVFCAHGAGFVVEWDKVDQYKHLESGWQEKVPEDLKESRQVQVTTKKQTSYSGSLEEDKELEAIFTRTFGEVKKKYSPSKTSLGYEKNNTMKDRSTKDNGIKEPSYKKDNIKAEEYLLVDGYNIIFSWQELDHIAKENMDAARYKLMDILCNYQGFKKCRVILVFDAYKVAGGVGNVQEYHNIHVVYTKEAETADTYIEKISYEMSRKHRVTVATSDAMEQMIIMGQGALRLSARDLKEEIERTSKEIRDGYLDKYPTNRNHIGKDFGDKLEEFKQ